MKLGEECLEHKQRFLVVNVVSSSLPFYRPKTNRCCPSPWMEELTEGSGPCSIARPLTSPSLPLKPTWILTVWMSTSRDQVRKNALLNNIDFMFRHSLNNDLLLPQMALPR